MTRKNKIDRTIKVNSNRARVLPFNLEVTFTDQYGKKEIYDFNHFSLIPKSIVTAFAEAFQSYGKTLMPITRYNAFYALNRFFLFCHEKALQGCPIETLKGIDTAAINEYISWLNNNNNSKNGKPLEVGTKKGALSAVKSVLNWLKIHRRVDMAEHCELPHIPWPGIGQAGNRIEPLDKHVLANIERICLKEIENVWADFQEGQQLIAKAEIKFIILPVFWAPCRIGKDIKIERVFSPFSSSSAL